MRYNDFTQFSVWQRAFQLLKTIYTLTKDFPEEERYGLSSDIRRASNSIVHNIAEGFGRFENKDKSRFYKFSRGSAYEVISLLYVSSALTYLSKPMAEQLILEYKTTIMELDKLIKVVENKPN